MAKYQPSQPTAHEGHTHAIDFQTSELPTMSAADESKRMSQQHQRWIVDALKEQGGACPYNHLVEVGEQHQCDTVGAMLKILKNRWESAPRRVPLIKRRKVIDFKGQFLMYPMHKDEVVTLTNPDYDPTAQ